jgi:hypothetical protein
MIIHLRIHPAGFIRLDFLSFIAKILILGAVYPTLYRLVFNTPVLKKRA